MSSCIRMPEASDKGQKYEVSFYDERSGQRMVMGWATSMFGVTAMQTSINAHPSWSFPQVRDREIGGPRRNL